MAGTETIPSASPYFYHHNTVVQVLVEKDFACSGSCPFSVSAQRALSDVSLGLIRGSRVNDNCTADIQSFAAFLYCFLAADQHDVCDSFFQDLCSSFIGSAVLGLRQNDGFLLFAFCSFFDYVNKSHDF